MEKTYQTDGAIMSADQKKKAEENIIQNKRRFQFEQQSSERRSAEQATGTVTGSAGRHSRMSFRPMATKMAMTLSLPTLALPSPVTP